MNPTEPRAASWKKSVYTMVLGDDRRGYVMHNSVTGHALDLNVRQHEALRRFFDRISGSLRETDLDLLEQLARSGFVVPADLDEERRQHERFRAHQRSTERLYLTIAPTMACNLHCTYCFQQEMTRSRAMTPEVQTGVVDFVRARLRADTRLAVVQWFGGEPLLDLGTIRSLTRRLRQVCDQAGTDYTAEMLTNGTLMTPEFIEELPQLRLAALQIPLDGSAATYASRKQVPIGRAERFYQSLVAAVPDILAAVGSLTIRINIDRDNAEAGREVVDLFHAAGAVDERIDFRLGFLNTQRGVIDCIPHDCLSPPEFAATEREFQSYLAAKGYRVYGRLAQREHPCIVPLRNAFTIDPTGRIGKCVPAMGTEDTAFSRIRPGAPATTLREIDRTHPFADFDPFTSDTCAGCPLLPACLGSCPKSHLPGRQVVCPHGRLADRHGGDLEDKVRLFAALPAVRPPG
jgi:uncharacterized protein